MGTHGKISTRPLEAIQSAQASGQEIQTFVAVAEVGCKGTRAPRRPLLSQSRGQHAHGIEGFEEKNRQEENCKKERRKEDRTQARGREEEDCEKSRKRASGAREKDPKGGLTAAGRKAFARKQGAHLKPGVTKKQSEMTPQDMRRKGSWAVRFYGRDKMPALVDGDGRPTRHALSAHAWGEPVPRTVPAARRMADTPEGVTGCRVGLNGQQRLKAHTYARACLRVSIMENIR